MLSKEKAQAFYKAVNTYDDLRIQNLVDENYIQHNPMVPTGRKAFMSLIPKLREHKTQIQNMRMIQDGHFVVMHHIWTNALPFGKQTMAAFHVIRFDPQGIIAEHWNATSELTPPNQSGRTLVDGQTEIKNLNETDINKIKIAELFDIWVGQTISDHFDILHQYFHPEFHQHNPHASDGINSFITAILSQSLQIQYIKQHKLLGEGNFILSISEGLYFGVPSACYDLFRFENEKIAEHWSIYQNIPNENVANENTMFNF